MVTLTKQPPGQVNKSIEQVDEFGAALHSALESIAYKFGLYQLMSQTGPLSPACLATQAGVSEKNVRVWLDAQTASNCLKRSSSTDLYCV